MSSHEELRAIALDEFARAGYGATSLQRIAELAGLSKSSVLYHYASKEALLEAAIGPAIDRLEAILGPLASGGITSASSAAFLGDFVDFLMQHRLEVHMFINQGPSLVGVPVVERANRLVLRIADHFMSTSASTEERMRFGMALGGAAYTLCMISTYDLEVPPADETRTALVTIMRQLLAPVPSTTPGQE